MPACDNRFLEILFFDRDPAGGIHVTQDAILGLDEIRVWIEPESRKAIGDTAPGEIRIGMDADRRGQELLFIT